MSHVWLTLASSVMSSQSVQNPTPFHPNTWYWAVLFHSMPHLEQQNNPKVQSRNTWHLMTSRLTTPPHVFVQLIVVDLLWEITLSFHTWGHSVGQKRSMRTACSPWCTYMSNNMLPRIEEVSLDQPGGTSGWEINGLHRNTSRIHRTSFIFKPRHQYNTTSTHTWSSPWEGMASPCSDNPISATAHSLSFRASSSLPCCLEERRDLDISLASEERQGQVHVWRQQGLRFGFPAWGSESRVKHVVGQ